MASFRFPRHVIPHPTMNIRAALVTRRPFEDRLPRAARAEELAIE
ncbi:hypothetical protein [Streptomyces purpurascens]|uniref:Uncharacterized protein n=1 Tax=Streptomyces purpurascens TaxID=1924 RepID=A0ABZ1MZE7_STREF|nr:hypothetical protein [Streptomyces purpurascens]